ncbi:MAG: 3-dehydroquinate synthase [Parafannyhessea sp.]|uniref:3-dehydroquinate synthase n=1 Tax=Parafannyhessea sp. TaxID=2847324 RepID=UPI003F0D5C9A
MSTDVVKVSTPSRAYDVVVGQGVIDEVGELTRKACGGPAACVISDSNVAPLYANAVAESLQAAGYRTTLQVFPAGEQHKRLSTLSDLLEGLAQSELSRDDVVVAVGGGVTGDMGGLAGALYLRGCKVVQVPTSLLAMVDSSVGGKTAVDLEAGKNLAGAFFQPSLVVADVDCLDTLTPALFTDSCGEVIKHGVIRDAELFQRLVRHPINAPDFDPAELQSVIVRNVEIKRDVVDQDERERGLRQILNFGHTIGHAIEAASDFRLGHGSSVAAGMCCIARASARMGWCPAQVADDIVSAVEAYGLPTDTTEDHDTLFSYAVHDKKRHGTTVNVVVPLAIGSVEVRRLSLDEFRHLIDLGCGTQA